MAQYEIINDNKVLFKKLYDIDRNGLKRAQKKWKPIFQYAKTTMAGNKKHEIIKVAQENLYMLKRLNERTSVYNVDKWNRDYEASQYYKRSHCQYPSIDFYKTQRCSSFGNMLNNAPKNNTKNNFYSKTQYSKNGFNYTNNTTNKSKKRKKFEDFSYRDLQIGKRSKSEFGDKEEQQFKKLNEIETPQEKEIDIQQNQEHQQEKEIDIQQNQENQQEKEVDIQQNLENQLEQEKEEQKEKEQEEKLEEQQIEENNTQKENNIEEKKNENESIKEEGNIKTEEENKNKDENIIEDENKKEEEIKVEQEQEQEQIKNEEEDKNE